MAANSVGMNKAITLGTLTLVDGSGTAASNYTLTGGTHTFDIAPLSVNVTGNRQYDGTNVIDSSDLLRTLDKGISLMNNFASSALKSGYKDWTSI